jgi:hypothetical protein
MCYGDMAHGSDGYYEQWAREQERLEADRTAEEQIDLERNKDEVDAAIGKE